MGFGDLQTPEEVQLPADLIHGDASDIHTKGNGDNNSKVELTSWENAGRLGTFAPGPAIEMHGGEDGSAIHDSPDGADGVKFALIASEFLGDEMLFSRAGVEFFLLAAASSAAGVLFIFASGPFSFVLAAERIVIGRLRRLGVSVLRVGRLLFLKFLDFSLELLICFC